VRHSKEADWKELRMTDELTPIPEYSQEDIDRAFQDALQAVENLHKKFSSLSEDAGYVKNVLTSSKPTLDLLFERAHDDPAAYPIVASGVDFLKGLTNEFTRLANSTDDLAGQFGPSVNSAGTFAMTTDSGPVFFDPSYASKPLPPPPARKSRADYAAKLRGLDPGLGKTYDEVWETFFGTSADPHRSALFTMRTLFDNFFAWLAPDDEVRGSVYWHKKEGDKPNQIWRPERLQYALDKHVKDENRSTILEATAKEIGALIEAANEAHNRGALDEDKASKTLMAMDNFLKDWLDSLPTELQPS
jgi:hypothetical protein